MSDGIANPFRRVEPFSLNRTRHKSIKTSVWNRVWLSDQNPLIRTKGTRTAAYDPCRPSTFTFPRRTGPRKAGFRAVKTPENFLDRRSSWRVEAAAAAGVPTNNEVVLCNYQIVVSSQV